MNVISTPTAATSRGPAQAASTSMAGQDSGSPSFEDLLSRTRRDSPEGKDDADTKRPQRDRDRKEEADSSPQDTLRSLESQAQQNLTAPLPIADLKTAAPDAPTAESATGDSGGWNTLPAGAGEVGGGTAQSSQSVGTRYGSRSGFSANTAMLTAGSGILATSSQSIQASLGSRAVFSADFPTSLPVTSRGAWSVSDAIEPAAKATAQQASLGVPGAEPSAKPSAGEGAAAGGNASQTTAFPVSSNGLKAANADGSPVPKWLGSAPENRNAQSPRTPMSAQADPSATDASDGTKISAALEMTPAAQRTAPQSRGVSVERLAAATESRAQEAKPITVADRIGTTGGTEDGAGSSGNMSPSIPAALDSQAGFSAKTPVTVVGASRPASPASPASPADAATAEQASLAASGAGAPAKSSAGPDTAVQDKAVEETFPPLNPNKIHVTDADGTPAAKERRNMPEQPNAQLLKPSANTVAGTSAADVASLPPVQEKGSAPRRIEPGPSGTPASVVSSAGATEFRGQAATPIQMADPISPATAAEFHAASHLVEHTMEIAERVSLKGDNHVEVQMRLPGGKDVTVSLHLANGEWKPVFKTESQSLCQALEQSWQQTAAQPSDRPVRFGTPVFESSQSQAGPGENSGRQPDGRDRHSARQEQAEIFPLLPIRNRPAVAAPDAARLTATGQVHLYA